jgi:hypothetical protein
MRDEMRAYYSQQMRLSLEKMKQKYLSALKSGSSSSTSKSLSSAPTSTIDTRR